MPNVRQSLRLLCLAVLLLAAAGCYMPDRFQAGMQIRNDGRFAFSYEGQLTALYLLQRLGRGDFDDDPEEFRRYVAIYERDLRRDSGFEEVSHLRQATFRTRYAHNGNLRRDRTFNFVRFNSRFFGVKSFEDGRVEISGDRLNRAYMDELIRGGFDTRGVFRLWTDAKVLEHNADAVEGTGLVMYTWNIQTMRDKLPRVVMALR